MKKSIDNHIDSLHLRLSKERSILRIIESKDFEEAYKSSSDQEKEKIDYYIETLRLEDLKLWFKSKIKTKDIENMTIVELRLLAKELGIKTYHLLKKELLIYKIRQFKVENHDGKKEFST